jgi:hypothetical protein
VWWERYVAVKHFPSIVSHTLISQNIFIVVRKWWASRCHSDNDMTLTRKPHTRDPFIIESLTDMAWKFCTHFLFFLLISKFSFATNIFNFPTYFPQFFTKNNVYLQPTVRDRFCSQSLAPFHTIYYALLFESIYICLTDIKKPVIICKIHRFFFI